MADLDRFAYGEDDPQNMEPKLICECTNYRCGNPVYEGEKNWDMDGEWFCSASCLALYIGAHKRVAVEETGLNYRNY